MASGLRLLFRLFYDPLGALSELLTSSPIFTGVLLAISASFLYHDLAGGELAAALSSLTGRVPRRGSALAAGYLLTRLFANTAPILFLAVVFVPASLFVGRLLDRARAGTFSQVLKSNYRPLASCVMFSWSAAHLAMLVPALLMTDLESTAVRALLPLPYFALLAALSLKLSLNLSYSRALVALGVSALSLVALPLLSGGLLMLMSSPLLLLLAILLVWGYVGNIMAQRRKREEFKRNLEIATLNPADASAHYNLGLIYQQQGQPDEAAECFRKAIEIDPNETDSHYQLGRIARREGRHPDAISHFDDVVRRDDDHSHGEVWREIGGTYLEAGQLDDALAALRQFLERRPWDAEGRYLYGLTLERLGRHEEAVEVMRAIVELVKTAPTYKLRSDRKWMQEAEDFLRSHPG